MECGRTDQRETAERMENEQMSCSLWRWTPSCDRNVCIGNCDSCDVENWDEYDEAFEEATAIEMGWYKDDADDNSDTDNI